MKLVKLLVVNLFFLLLLCLFLEGAARVIYPEFRNDVYSDDVTRGIRVHYGAIKGLKTRVPYPDQRLEEVVDKPLLLFIGDSITHGYGTDYEDIYWVQLQRLFDLFCTQSPTVVGIANQGNNLIDELEGLNEFLSCQPNTKICGIIYQWDFNDITPYTRDKIKSQRPMEGMAVARWRHKWLNQSVFLRVVQHYAGIWMRKTRGTCEERGMDALGVYYTWTFGSKPFAEESERLWTEYGLAFESFARICRARGATPYVLVAPTLYDIDITGADPYWNKLRLDFSCATIKPLERLKKLCSDQNIQMIDPTEYLRESYARRVKGGNFTPYYFAGDDNHFNPVAAAYIAEYLAKYLIFESPAQCVATSRAGGHPDHDVQESARSTQK